MYILIKGFKGCNSASVQVDGHYSGLCFFCLKRRSLLSGSSNFGFTVPETLAESKLISTTGKCRC